MAKKKETKEDDQGSPEEIRDARLKELFAAAKKKFGKDSMVYASEFKYKDVYRISTGILPLDYALGGGVPVGRITMFYGNKSSAKTTNCLRTVGMAQKLCSACWTELEGGCTCGKNRKVQTLWLDVESVWMDKWSKIFLNTEDIILVQPETAEQAIDIADSALRSGSVDIIVIDSIAAMTSSVEIEKEAAESTVGVQARLVGQQMRKFISGMNTVQQQEGYKPTVFLINQIRMKIGGYGNPETVPGGMSQGFATSVEIRTASGKTTMDGDGIGARPLNIEMRGKIEKNKTAAPKMEAEWKMSLSDTEVKKVGDIIDEPWAFTMGEQAGLIETSHASATWNGKTYRGRSGLEKHWMEDRADYKYFKSELMKILIKD